MNGFNILGMQLNVMVHLAGSQEEGLLPPVRGFTHITLLIPLKLGVPYASFPPLSY